MVPYLLWFLIPLVPMPFNCNGRGTHGLVPTNAHKDVERDGLAYCNIQFQNSSGSTEENDESNPEQWPQAGLDAF